MFQATSFFEYLRTFAGAVPREYRQRYDAFAIADIARIAFERGQKPLNAGKYRGATAPGTPLCLVGCDRHLLVSALSRALVLTRSELVFAEAFTLDDVSGLDGVVGLFSVRPRSRSDRMRREQSDLLVELLVALGERPGGVRRAGWGPRHAPAAGSAADTTVRFLEGLDGTLSVLEVETRLKSGLLGTLVDVFMAERLQIVHCEVQAQGDRVRDRFRLVEHDGASIAPSRWLQIQSHVLDAISRMAAPLPAMA